MFARWPPLQFAMNAVVYTAVAILFSMNAAYAEPMAGTIKSVRGDVNIIRDGATIKAVKRMKLNSSDEIVTGYRSSVGIILLDDTLIAFGPKTVSKLDKFSYDPVKKDGNLFISIITGSMRFVTGWLGKRKPEMVAINLPTATLGVRGTDFIVSVK